MDSLLRDLRFGLRTLAAKPGFTAVAVVALALGIGANTAIFSVVNALVMRPLPFDDLDRIVAVWEKIPARGVERNETAAANYHDWRREQSAFDAMAMYAWWSVNLTGVDVPEQVQGFRVTSSLFDVLGVKPTIGRGFTAEEEEPGKDQVVILHHGFWMRRFGGDPEIIGKTISLNGVARTVVGVMPQAYNFPKGGELLAPLAQTTAQAANRQAHYLLTVARLKPAVTVEQAEADLNAIAARLEQQYPATNTGRGVAVRPLLNDTVGDYRPALLMLLGAVGFVLLIACANVANLLLARAVERNKEVAIRTALGASRWRIVRQMLTESVMIAILGGALGVAAAVWGVGLLKSAVPEEFARFVYGWANLSVDARVLGFSLGLSVLTGVVFGLAPALQASRPDLNESLKEGAGKSSASRGHSRLRSLLIVGEVALSLVLLISAGLMVKSFLRLVNDDPGFHAENVLTMQIILPRARYREDAQRTAFYHQLLQRVAALPGVESAGIVNHLPLGGSNSSAPFLIEGRPEPPPGQDFDGRYRVCSPDYFAALSMTVREGRAFTDQDTASSQPVIIVNETLARRYWPGESALGKRMRFPGDPARNPWMEVVGVVRDVKHELTLEVTPEYYLPHAQDASGEMVLVARTHGEPLALAPATRGEVLALDKDQPVSFVRTMEEVRSQSVLLQRFFAAGLGIFAALALLLASVGVYGVMSYAVTQRARELGIRMALGATSRDILGLVVGQGVKLTAAGLATGLVAAFALTRVLAGMLHEVSATDFITFITVPLLLAVVALAACYVPARRATRVDPIVALRYE